MVKGDDLDWEKLKERIDWGIRFLDDVIEVNRFPLPRIRDITFANRKIGLGVMGFADMLIKLGIPYHSPQAIRFAERLMRFIRQESVKASASLAEEREVFPNYEKSVYAKKGKRVRNATVNTIAPTGTISIIAGCSSGIEPLFAISFVRNVLSGTRLFEVNPLFEEAAKEGGFYSKEVIAEIARSGSLQKIRGIPARIKRTFVTAFDVPPKQHVELQAAFQRYTDNSVSKTINLPAEATVEDVRRIYLLSYKRRCKGITIYRYGTQEDQVLSFGYGKPEELSEVSGPVSADSEYSGGCVTGACPF
jgi:ribonucleoside-diphosphate reductase alpha chain